MLHPAKTKVVYCKDDQPQGRLSAIIQFDFLGYSFRPRLREVAGRVFGVSFSPAASHEALKAIRQAVRRWSLQTGATRRWTTWRGCSTRYIRGWINYYGHFYKSALYPTLRQIDASWPVGTTQVQAPRTAAGRAALAGTGDPIISRVCLPTGAASVWTGPNNGSRMRREAHVRFWERAGVEFRRATHLAAELAPDLRQDVDQRERFAPLDGAPRAVMFVVPVRNGGRGGQGRRTPPGKPDQISTVQTRHDAHSAECRLTNH